MGTDFQEMIKSFGGAITVKRTSAGSYVDGRWVEGSESDIAMFASIQPASGEQLAFLPENQRTSDVLVAYCTSEVFTSRSKTTQNSDVIVYQGERYKVLSVKRWLPTQQYWEAMIAREDEV